MTLGTRILIGLALGIALGFFVGELAAPLKGVGDIFVGLLQMTVLPYIIVTLTANVGRLSLDRVEPPRLQSGANRILPLLGRV